MTDKGLITHRLGPFARRTDDQSHLLIIGPTRSGKSVSGIKPNILDWQGPLVSTSTKGEMLRETWEARAERGPVYCLDLRPRIYKLPEGVREVQWSPLWGVNDPQNGWAKVKDLASAMVQATRTGDDFWAERGTSILAPLLLAAAIGSQPLSRVKEWLNAADLDQAFELLKSKETSGWSGIREAISELYQFKLKVGPKSGGHGDSITSSASSAMAGFTGRVLEMADQNNFDPECILRENATLYVISPPIGKVYRGGPMIVGLCEAIVAARRHEIESEQAARPPMLGLMLDEF